MRIRPRRLRSHDSLRRLVRETSIGPDHLIAPMFVTRDYALARPIDGMPGCRILTLDEAGREAQAIDAAGLAGVLLFGVTGSKDEAGRQADAPGGPTAGAIAAIRAAAPRLSVWADVCLCGYTSHGHCGIVSRDSRGALEVDNDATLDRLARVAVACAQAGADVIAPSDMMDGRVRVIRDALDRAGQTQIAIASYAVKYASAFYGPFRGAAGSSPVEGDRRGYQMDPANAREAVREALLDASEGADVLIVKPALAYGDVVRAVRTSVHIPVAAYHVSGEYAMVKAAAERGWIDERAVVLETLLASRRAGASAIITYAARAAAQWIDGRG